MSKKCLEKWLLRLLRLLMGGTMGASQKSLENCVTQAYSRCDVIICARKINSKNKSEFL